MVPENGPFGIKRIAVVNNDDNDEITDVPMDDVEALKVDEEYFNNGPDDKIRLVRPEIPDNERLTAEAVDQIIFAEYGEDETEKADAETGVEIPTRRTITSFKVPYWYKTIEKDAFSACINLEKVELPEGLLYIGVSAFEECIALKEINFPWSLECIDDFAFRGCSKLSFKKLILPGNLLYIGRGTFEDCPEIYQVCFPENIEVIEDGAFCHCQNLRKVKFESGKDTMAYLGYGAFQRCRKIWHFSRKKLPESRIKRAHFGQVFEDCSCSFSFFSHPIRKTTFYFRRQKDYRRVDFERKGSMYYIDHLSYRDDYRDY